MRRELYRHCSASSALQLLPGRIARSIINLGLPTYVQILRAGVECYPARGASCLSAEYAWQQLMPDFAALLRSLCVALEAWPQEVPKPKIFGELDVHHSPLGLQYMVCSSLCGVLHAQHLLSQFVLLASGDTQEHHPPVNNIAQ